MATRHTRSNARRTSPRHNGVEPAGDEAASDNNGHTEDEAVTEFVEGEDPVAAGESEGDQSTESAVNPEMGTLPEGDFLTGEAGTEVPDVDPTETDEWLQSLDYILQSKGPERASYLLTKLEERAYRAGVKIPFSA